MSWTNSCWQNTNEKWPIRPVLPQHSTPEAAIRGTAGHTPTFQDEQKCEALDCSSFVGPRVSKRLSRFLTQHTHHDLEIHEVKPSECWVLINGNTCGWTLTDHDMGFEVLSAWTMPSLLEVLVRLTDSPCKCMVGTFHPMQAVMDKVP